MGWPSADPIRCLFEPGTNRLGRRPRDRTSLLQRINRGANSGSLWRARRIDSRIATEDIEQIPLQCEAANPAAVIVDYQPLLQFQSGRVGQAHDLAMGENVAIGTDAALAESPVGGNVAVFLATKENIVDPSSAGDRKSVV